MLIKNVSLVLPNHPITLGNIVIDNKTITKISQTSDETSDDLIYDFKDMFAIPGLIDLHIHGADGISITDSDKDSLDRLSNALVKFGITGFLWTTMSAPIEELDEIMTKVSTFEHSKGALCYGINIEGSFISPQRAGSHVKEYIFEPSIELLQRWLTLSNNKIKIITIAPEKTSKEFIDFLLKNNIIPSIGHSKANYEQTITALSHGASYFTHLGNATGMLHQREPGLVGAALLDKNSSIEIICDGVHLHPAIVKIFSELKGLKNVVLVSDGTCVMGMPKGIYKWYDQDAVFDGESLKLPDDTIAGGVQPLSRAIKNIMTFTDCTLNEAVYMASTLPAQRLGIYDKYGSIEKDKIANITIIDKDYEVVATFVEGKLVYQR
jgi:N-acetylglucosamine-6-phosphate deacetylase